MFNELENISNISNVINRLVTKSSKPVFIIIDGDRTLIPDDSTIFFFKYLDLEFNDLKIIFQKYGYSFEAFHNVALYYSKIEKEKYTNACNFSADSVEIYPEFKFFIHSVKEIAELILITSGIKQIWKSIIDKNSIEFMHLIGGNYFPEDSFIVDRNAKGIIANALRKAGKTVFAFGDTLIDYDMLSEANHSYLVVNEKMNKDFIPYANEIRHLEQLSFLGVLHPNLKHTNLSEIRKLIQKYNHDISHR
ncbi:MAG TPA: HAD family hydrolase [Saprospiraceae bacterium]|nr:HAD family hydrolase [Saprospiraceae bacterium]